MTPHSTAQPPWWTSDEWETPPEEVETLEQEFGSFDLDPCAREATCKAQEYYTKDDDGLQQEWYGKVWLNPPYSDPGPWVQKAQEEVVSGRATLVVACLPAATDTHWFHTWVLPYAELRFRRGRIKFLGWEGQPLGTPKAGTIYAIYRRRLT
jgi:phage N-6-adenine-methyltransferase